MAAVLVVDANLYVAHRDRRIVLRLKIPTSLQTNSGFHAGGAASMKTEPAKRSVNP
jgi:hypothetical protein